MLVDPREGIRYEIFSFFLPQKTMGMEGKHGALKTTVDGSEIPNNHWDGAKTLWILGYLLHQLVSRISAINSMILFTSF